MGTFDQPRNEPLFSMMRDDDKALISAIQQAKDTLPHFRRAFSEPQYKGAYFLVKALFVDTGERGKGALVWKAAVADQFKAKPTAHIWLKVNDVLEDLFFCSTFEAPQGFGGLGAGQSFVLNQTDIEDWMINRNGRLYGGLTLRLQRSALPPKERESFDQYAGITQYSDERP